MSLALNILLISSISSKGFGLIDSKDTLLSTTASTGINNTTVEKSFCARFGTCKANEDYSFKSCYCDSFCKHFNDCCFDAELKSPKLPETFQYLSCVNFVSLNAIPENSNQGFYMVSKCPERTITTEFDIKCEEGLNNDIPVTDINHLTYRNEYCALCHGVEDYTFWSSVFMLDKCARDFNYESIADTNIAQRMDILKEQGCQMYFVPHNPYEVMQNKPVFPRFCINNVKANFINDGEGCQSFFNPVFVKTSIYVRNAMCLNNYSSFTDEAWCVLPSNWYTYFTSARNNMKPMTALFQFKSFDSKDDSTDCEQYNTYTQKACAEPSCKSTSSKVCIKESLNSFRFIIDLFLESHEIHMKTFERAVIMLFMSLPVYHYQLQLMALRYSVSCGEGMGPQRCCFTGGVPIVIRRNMAYVDMKKIRSAILDIEYIYQENVQNKTYTVYRKMKTDKIMCTKNKTTKKFFLPTGLIESYIKIIDIEPVALNHSKIPKTYEVKVEVGTEFDQNGIASFLKVLSWNRTFPIPILSDLSKSSFIGIQVIITYVTMGLSSFTLIFVISMFVYFKLYIKFADQICINIMCTLFFTNLLFMSGIGFVDNSVVCFIIGVVLHFLWLSVFTWVSLFTIMFTVTLWKMELNLTFNVENNCSKRTLYVAGYGIPGIMVSFCILLETFWPELHMDYNGDVCFPTGYPENIVFFTAPVVLSIVVNVTLLVLASNLLRKHYANSLIHSTQIITVYAVTVIKLCLFSGFFWIFGILSQAFENDVMAFIFIICCGSQGLIFAICFGTSTRMRRKYFELANRNYLNHATQSNESLEMNLNKSS